MNWKYIINFNINCFNVLLSLILYFYIAPGPGPSSRIILLFRFDSFLFLKTNKYINAPIIKQNANIPITIPTTAPADNPLFSAFDSLISNVLLIISVWIIWSVVSIVGYFVGDIVAEFVYAVWHKNAAIIFGVE